MAEKVCTLTFVVVLVAMVLVVAKSYSLWVPMCLRFAV